VSRCIGSLPPGLRADRVDVHIAVPAQQGYDPGRVALRDVVRHDVVHPAEPGPRESP